MNCPGRVFDLIGVALHAWHALCAPCSSTVAFRGRATKYIIRLGAWQARKGRTNNTKRHMGQIEPWTSSSRHFAFCLSCKGTCHTLLRPSRYDSHRCMLQASPLHSFSAYGSWAMPTSEKRKQGSLLYASSIIPRSKPRCACCRLAPPLGQDHRHAALSFFVLTRFTYKQPTAQPQTYSEGRRARMAWQREGGHVCGLCDAALAERQRCTHSNRDAEANNID